MENEFSNFAMQMKEDIDQDYLDKFKQQPNIISIVAQAKQNLIQTFVPEFALMRHPVKRLETEEEVFAAACVIYYYSVDVTLDLLENYDVYKYSIYLSKLLFQQQTTQLPLSFYSAFSVVMMRLLECIELKKTDDIQSVNSILKSIHFLTAFDEVESSKLMCNLARDICARFYGTVNNQTIDLCCQFLDTQQDYFKLIELFSLRHFSTKFTKAEQRIAEVAYEFFDVAIDNLINRVARPADQGEGADEQNAYTEDDLQEAVELYTHFILMQLAQTAAQLQEYAVATFAIPFLVKTQLGQVDQLIAALLRNKVGQYKLLAVLLTNAILRTESVVLSALQIQGMMEAVLAQLLCLDDGYLILVLQMVQNLIQLETNLLDFPNVMQQLIDSRPEPSRRADVDLQKLSINTVIAELNAQQQQKLFIYTLCCLELLPITLYVCVLKLSTHNGFVASQISVRKAVVELYGALLLQKPIQTVLVSLSGQSTAQGEMRSFTGENRAIVAEMLGFGEKSAGQVAELKTFYTRFCEVFPFRSQSLREMLLGIWSRIQQLLGQRSSAGEFLVQELLFRLQDESQQVKRLAAQQIKALIKKNYACVGFVFTDLLQMQYQDNFMIQCFDELIMQPLYDLDQENCIAIFRFLEASPMKLFESTFADLFKERTIDFRIVENMLRFNEIGAFIMLQFMLVYAQAFTKPQQQTIINNLHAHLLQNIDGRQHVNIYILGALTSSSLLDLVEFDLTVFLTNQSHREQEQLNRVTSMLVIRAVQQSAHPNVETEEMLSRISQDLDAYVDQVPTALSGVTDKERFMEAGTKLLLNLSYLSQNRMLSQQWMKSFARRLVKLLYVHPLASHPLLFFIYESKDIEFRLNVFDQFIEVVNKTTCCRTANNVMLAVLSAVYAYPDELGQFVGLLLENEFFKSSYIVQRHFLYVIYDLERLCLIKLSADVFTSLFMFLISPNTDLQALSERLLLGQPIYAALFVQNFLRCMETMHRDQVSLEQRAVLYAKVLNKLPQTSKYQLLNALLEKAAQLLRSPQQHTWFFDDLMGIIQSGVVQVTLQEEWSKADKIIKKLNLQYSIANVLPRLFECLQAFNAAKLDDVQQKTTTAIRAVCQQMHVSYPELVAQFGEQYCIELVQVKW